MLHADPAKQSVEENLTSEAIKGKVWLRLHADSLPRVESGNPFAAFKMLSPAAQAYYLPAFLRMIEMEAEHSRGLADKLSSYIAGASPAAAEMCSKLDDVQKRCVMGFLTDWCPRASAKKLGRLPPAWEHALLLPRRD